MSSSTNDYDRSQDGFGETHPPVTIVAGKKKPQDGFKNHKPKIVRVPQELTVATLAELKDEVKKALNYTVGTLSYEDIEWLCMRSRIRLFAAVATGDWETEDGIPESRIEGVCGAEIVQYPSKKACNLVFLAGMSGTFRRWSKHGLLEMERWAKECGCSIITGTGRRGWSKSGAEAGFAITSLTLLHKRIDA